MHFRNTRIHAASVDLVVVVQSTIDSLPRGHATMSDQLRRSSTSIVLNFAEGCSRTTPKERRRFFDIARGSAFEVAAAFDVCRALKIVDDCCWQQAIARCDGISAMLYSFN